MSSNTPNLGLLKKDPMVDGNETFNIETMLNENWDKIDEAVGKVREDLGNIDVDIPEASLTEKGIVQLSSATNGTRENVAATEKAVKAAYDKGSEGVTAAEAAQVMAEAAETPAGAQSKANAAENNAKSYIDAKPWQKHKVSADDGTAIDISGQNLNNILLTGFYKGNGMINAPALSSGWGYVEVIRHAETWVLQKIYDLHADRFYMRRRTDSGWTAWTQDLFTSVANGKQAIASAISGKGVPASGSDEFAVLASKIIQIKTGIQVATGNTAFSSGARTITNLPFKPQILVVYGRAETFNNSGYQARARGYGIAYNTGGTNIIGFSLPSFLYSGGYEIERNIQELTNVVFGANSVSFDGITGTVSPNGTAYIVFGV
nr:pyocin knob domain-containing protein [Paenibacillus sp. Y412MC10]